MSKRGLVTVLLIAALVIGTVAVIVINNMQDVCSRQWQEEIGIKVEEE